MMIDRLRGLGEQLEGHIGRQAGRLAERRRAPSLLELYERGDYRMHKWLNYFHVYERHFAPFRNRAPTLLEIGVQQGGSARLFRDYLGAGARVIGVDIDPACADHAEPPDIVIEIGDQSDPAFLRGLAADHGPFDIVLDDGGHTLNQILTSHEALFEHVRTPGVYMIEDTCCQYWDDDRFRDRPGDSIGDFYSRINEVLNRDMAREELFDHWHTPPAERMTTKETSGADRLVQSLHLYESMAVIEKGERPIPYCELRT